MLAPPPPVPPIPSRWSTFSSLPFTQGLRTPLPFPPATQYHQSIFLDSERQPSADQSTHHSIPHPSQVGLSTPTPAPPSHHTPVMGLGGALISSNNARAQQDAAHAARIAQTRMLTAARRRQASFMNPTTFADLLLHNGEDGHPHIRRWVENRHENFLRLYNRLRGREQLPVKHHLQSYTHPDQPEPGFTFDFAPNSSDEDLSRTRYFPRTSANAPIVIDDNDEQSSSKPSTSFEAPSSSSALRSSISSKLTINLVCARCLEPLLLNESLGSDDDGRRVWALRCGHLVDEKCLNEIGQPDEDVEAESQNLPIPGRKNKGKAKAKARPTYSEAVAEVIEANNSIRSRLRSATTTGASSSTSSTAGMAETLPQSRGPPQKRRRTAAPPKVEAVFEWKCPVPSCGLLHASVKIYGRWGPEKEVSGVLTTGSLTRATPRGAIPVFA